jgi:hypothetical protein
MVKSAKNTAESAEIAPLQSVLRRSRICFERFILDALDAEQTVRRVLREQMSASAGGAKTLNANDVAHVARMAVVTTC